MRTKHVLLIGSFAVILFTTVASAFRGTYFGTLPQSNLRTFDVVVKQLPSENDRPVVELHRAKAISTNPDTINDLTFVIKNNSQKAITAYSLVINASTEAKGNKSQHTELFMTDTVINRDIQEMRKLRPITEGTETVAEVGGLMRYEPDSVVTGITIYLDYVEFEDGSSVSLPNTSTNSSQRINNTREGAAKYKEWLRRIYTESANPQALIISQLQAQSLPDNLELTTGNMRQGAKMYRNSLLDTYKNKGFKAVEYYLSR